MFAVALAALTITPSQPPAKHEEQNPLFKNLLETGITIGDAKVKFPAPLLVDGLSAAKQTEIIKSLIAADYDYSEFTRDSITARHMLKIGDVKPADPKMPGRAVNVYFIVHADFKVLEDDKFLDKLTGNNKGGAAKTVPLTDADLKKRNIALPNAKVKNEGYGHVEFDFLDKVRLKATGHAIWSRNSESVVAAAEIDPRFQDDKEFPNEWRSMTRSDGEMKLGPAHPWTGAGMYLKVTKLQEPAGALFVEQHIIFSEPTLWFDGANLLRSKLPIAIQESVRTMRREFQNAK
jgi:hypothetical protein